MLAMGQTVQRPRRLRRRDAMPLLAAAVAGCGLSDGPLYTLTPEPGPMLTGAPRNVAVRGVSLPQFLQRQDIVRSSAAPLAWGPPSEWWAEPLDVMIGQVLALNLIQRLPGTRVFLDLQAPHTATDAWIDLSILRFDTERTGEAVVQAQVQVIGHWLLTRLAWKRVTPANGSTQALAVALSIALARFSDLVAALLVESWQVPFR